MAQPTFRGRRLPLNDWEGDDSTPGAGGRYVTCMDTAAGRMVYYATNGRVNHDGKYYRAHVVPPDPNGVNFPQMDDAVKRVNANLDIVYHSNWTRAQVTAWLKRGQGLIIAGRYDTIPRAYRHQASATFMHAVFVSHFNRAGTGMRYYDPLNPKTHEYGEHVPTSILWPFLESSGGLAGFVPLHPLRI